MLHLITFHDSCYVKRHVASIYQHRDGTGHQHSRHHITPRAHSLPNSMAVRKRLGDALSALAGWVRYATLPPPPSSSSYQHYSALRDLQSTVIGENTTVWKWHIVLTCHRPDVKVAIFRFGVLFLYHHSCSTAVGFDSLRERIQN